MFDRYFQTCQSRLTTWRVIYQYKCCHTLTSTVCIHNLFIPFIPSIYALHEKWTDSRERWDDALTLSCKLVSTRFLRKCVVKCSTNTIDYDDKTILVWIDGRKVHNQGIRNNWFQEKSDLLIRINRKFLVTLSRQFLIDITIWCYV